MKKLVQILFPIMMLASETLLTNDKNTTLKDYIRATYGDELIITDAQLSQLSWVMDNPFVTPEMNHHKPGTIHREVPRALSRLYNLQRLRSGTEHDYLKFIAPQQAAETDILTLDSFKQLSAQIRALSPYRYDVLAAATVISAVTLSPMALEKARRIIGDKVPADSVKFLSATAPVASRIYPLAESLGKQFKADDHLFSVAFMPDSHLRHMMYNEGSLAMYEYIKQGLKTGTLTRDDLAFWYLHWAINITGFRGHLAPKGSLYLTQNTYNAMTSVRDLLNRLDTDEPVNPMRSYLSIRAEWLELPGPSHTEEQLALASLAASLRLFTPDQGKQLYNAFKQLSPVDQKRWQAYSQYQFSNTRTPAPTYAPALFANAVVEVGLADTIVKALPLFLDVIDKEKQMRKSGQLSLQVPVSFRELSQHQQVHRLLHQPEKGRISINPVTGIASMK